MIDKDELIKELEEELGFKVNTSDLKHLWVFKSIVHIEFQSEYLLIWDGDISSLKLEEDEIDGLKWVDIGVYEKVVKDRRSNWILAGFEKEIIPKLKSSL